MTAPAGPEPPCPPSSKLETESSATEDRGNHGPASAEDSSLSHGCPAEHSSSPASPPGSLLLPLQFRVLSVVHISLLQLLVLFGFLFCFQFPFLVTGGKTTAPETERESINSTDLQHQRLLSEKRPSPHKLVTQTRPLQTSRERRLHAGLGPRHKVRLTTGSICRVLLRALRSPIIRARISKFHDRPFPPQRPPTSPQGP